jgi:subtilisin family serine protease
MKYTIVLLLCLFACRKVGDIQHSVNSQKITLDYKEGEVLVEFKGNPSGRVKRTLKTKGKQIHVLQVDDAKKAVDDLKNDPNVSKVSLNYKREKQQFNDPLLSTQWGVSKINAQTAWASGNIGNKNVYVMVADEGSMYWHPDLYNSMWRNPHDTIDGIDNDRNGYVDDYRGWNAMQDNNQPWGGASFNHGTHVSGIIGGTANNEQGISGISPKVTIIAGKFLEQYGFDSDAIELFYYAVDLKQRHGINLVAINCSFGGGGRSDFFKDAIDACAAANILVICAAGNSRNDNDLNPFYPASFSTECPNVITVGSMNEANEPSYFTNYGANSVHIFAPGSNIMSTIYNGDMSPGYITLSGTSMAAPEATGAIALYYAVNPNAHYSQAKAALLQSSIKLPSLQGKCVSGGYVNVSGFTGNSGGHLQPDDLVGAVPYIDRTPPTTPVLSITAVGTTSVSFSWTPSQDTSGIRMYWLYYYPTTETPNTNRANLISGLSTSFNFFGLQAGVEYGFFIQAQDGWNNWSGYSNTVIATPSGTPDTEPPTAPPNLRVTDSTTSSLSIDFDASTDNVSVNYYRVRWNLPGQPYQAVNVAQTNHVITGLQAGTEYQIGVLAVDPNGNESPVSTTTGKTKVVVETPPVPGVSASLKGSAVGQVHQFLWTTTGTITSQVLEVKANGVFVPLATVTGNTYSYNPGTNRKMVYRLRVNNSVYSNEVTIQSKGKK